MHDGLVDIQRPLCHMTLNRHIGNDFGGGIMAANKPVDNPTVLIHR